MQPPQPQPPCGPAQSYWLHVRAFLSGFADYVDFLERTFDRGFYLLLRGLLPPHADGTWRQEYPNLLLLRCYFQRRAQAGQRDESQRVLSSWAHSSAKGAIVGAVLGVLISLAKNLRAFDDFYGGIYFYPRRQFFGEVFPSLFRGGLRAACASLGARGVAEAARLAGLADQPAEGGRASVAASGPRAVLGVSRDADAAAIRKAYRKLALRLHPDKNRHLGPAELRAAEARFREVQAAYEKLAGKEELDATNSEIFSAEYFEVTEEQFSNVARMARLMVTGVALVAFARS